MRTGIPVLSSGVPQFLEQRPACSRQCSLKTHTPGVGTGPPCQLICSSLVGGLSLPWAHWGLSFHPAAGMGGQRACQAQTGCCGLSPAQEHTRPGTVMALGLPASTLWLSLHVGGWGVGSVCRRHHRAQHRQHGGRMIEEIPFGLTSCCSLMLGYGAPGSQFLEEELTV